LVKVGSKEEHGGRADGKFARLGSGWGAYYTNDITSTKVLV
jgi:hypothetical protein